MIESVFFIPLAQGDLSRVANTVNSIRTFCRDYRIYLLLDGPSADSLNPALLGDDVIVLQNPVPTRRHWGKIWAMQCRAMVAALDIPELSARAIFVKIDADAIVVRAGLVERAQRIFDTRPAAGQLGQGFSSILGGRLNNPGWANYYQKMMGWRGALRFVRHGAAHGRVAQAWGAFARFRRLLNLAASHGYAWGEFAIGGSYIVRRAVVEYMARPDVLDDSPFLWLPDTGEDGVMTPYVYAAGYSLMDDGSDGGIFGVEGKQIRMHPQLLRQRGHYIIHPTKYGYEDAEVRWDEDQLVQSLCMEGQA
ncbi:MAG: hypothetical protein KGZ67_01165 [Hydrogenophaga sp.]|jgi:hypothetical protein|nr:hypothetical protein [Hydrogenophaga sp.]